MEIFNDQFFILTLALVGVVIIIAALLSGLIDRSDLPQVGVFLALGAMLGPAGLGLLDVTLQSPTLRVVATLSLVLVLFTDAVSLSLAEVRRHGALAFRVLGPGTLLSAALIALAGWLVLELPFAAAAMLGAALASTDPVMLRGLLRRPGLPEPVRLALRLESGLNDAVLLPIVLVAMAFLNFGGFPNQTDWARIGLDLFLLGPGAGIAVGLLAIGALEMIRRKTGVRRDYESIYSLGVAFAAYAAAEAVHGSGFLAAFAAGLTIAALDVELCDCFLEYGQTTAEMTLLFTFVLFGSSLIWSGFAVLSWPVFLFAVAVVLIRPVAFFVSLAGTRLDSHSRLLIAWFGPRGLSSLLLILLPVFAAVSGTQLLFSICCFIVLLSVVLHGGSLMFLKRDGSVAKSPQPPATIVVMDASSTTESAVSAAKAGELVTIGEMKKVQQSGEPYLLLDVRAARSFADSDLLAQGALRIPPDRAVERLKELDAPRQTWLFAFCA
jgi:NhaP-type Na+/H+ or K+/H+ antiporter